MIHGDGTGGDANVQSGGVVEWELSCTLNPPVPTPLPLDCLAELHCDKGTPTVQQRARLALLTVLCAMAVVELDSLALDT